VEFSTDGGATFAPATPGYGNGSLTGLVSSPGGTVHTFLWNSVDDLVGTPTTPSTQVRLRVTPSDGNAGSPASSSNFTVDNSNQRVVAVASATYPHTFLDVGTKEMAVGDLVAESMKARYGTQLAFQNGHGVCSALPSTFAPTNMSLRRGVAGYAPGPPFDLVMGDFLVMLPFSDRVVTRTVTGAQLWSALEVGFSSSPGNNNGFPQIAGFTVTFKNTVPAGSRVQSVTLAGGAAIPRDGTTFTIAINDYMAGGGDGYGMFADGQGTVRELQSQVVADYAQSLGTITPTTDGRITIVP
jgi:5'-nucleotidase